MEQGFNSPWRYHSSSILLFLAENILASFLSSNNFRLSNRLLSLGRAFSKRNLHFDFGSAKIKKTFKF
ncbi:hypothetical protein CH367_02625 [Leptospira barantonii]|uniref:DUF1564 family protein n=1 Tax=Leptospira barantonii TaxID=2023184 RepID=A0ABX4NRN5_9LEPT|nr:hypothetical protein CH367_02625 [Leptospira barantonii]